MADRYGPVNMPDREWRKPEIRHALRERAAGTLLSLVQRHAGVSQARLATATGIGQGRLNEIINGHRQVAGSTSWNGSPAGWPCPTMPGSCSGSRRCTPTP
jgi:hypothetical protein